ncbi:WD repeat-containing protein 90-like, partial [Actinia tenebrosa]|uniref:WD repeat-containing protein 90-like n=1 Tax=Actinia tenebrosa TaxID=6105 RepID=A0A6P8IZS3_ACTTE
MSSKLWQHPFVNVLKHFGVGEWKKCTKEGDVSPIMDKQMKGTIYRISGSIPAGNYIQFPRTTTQTLGLTGQYLYIMFKPIPTKYFVVHIDVAANDGSAIRISFSNLFKEFKSTSTWLQFPFVSNPSPTSVEAKTTSDMLIANLVGTAPQSSRWSLLVLDLHYILSAYLNLSYAYLKNIRLCANMFLKGVFTSDVDYQPGLTSSEARKLGLIAEGVIPLPKEMAFPLPKGAEWQTLYDYVRFPPAKTGTRLGIITNLKEKKTDIHVHSKRKQAVKEDKKTKEGDVKSKVYNQDSRPQKLKHPKETEVISEPFTDRHVYATIKRPSVRKKIPSKLESFTYHPSTLPQKHTTVTADSQSLKPDPILSLKKIIGFGGGTYKEGLWNVNGTSVLYPCHAIIVSMDIATGRQEFFMGHTDKVSALAFDGAANLLASAQAGTPSLIRIWKYQTRKCAALFRTQVSDIHCLSLSVSGNILCAVGRDSHGKQLVTVWDTSQAVRGGQVSLLAKAHTDVHINRMRIADFDDSRMLSCGKENIRFWRLRNGSLRSCPIELRQHSMTEFTDIVYGLRERSSATPNKIYCSTTSGAIYQIDYHKIVLDRVIKLLPIGGHHSNNQVSINVLVVNEMFCATGSDDGYLRMWTPDFSKVLLEAEHEGPVTVLSPSRDGSNILAGTSLGNLGILNTYNKSYKTIMRSHTETIHAMNIDHTRRRIGTVSADFTIRIWDMDTLTQLYDFQAPKEEPCAIAFHPFNTCFASGFIDGTVRVFDIQSTNLVAEHKQHRGRVTGLVFAPNGGFLFSSGSLGALAMYSAGNDSYDLVRMLLDMTPRNEDLGPNALSVSHDSKRLAFIGPSEYTICVVDARSLDEVLRVDITTVASPGRAHIDTATMVAFATPELNQLLVVTSSNRLLKLNGSNGLLLSEVSNLHRHSCSCLDTSPDGRYLATAGDNLIKVWDYHMRLDINFQVFIGHCERIKQLLFTPGNQDLISAGEAIFIWDFHGRKAKLPKKRSLGTEENNIPLSKQQGLGTPQRMHPTTDLSNTSKPRERPPEPTRYEPLDLDMSPVRDLSRDMSREDESPEVIAIPRPEKTDMHQAKVNKAPLMETSFEQLKVQDKVSFKESPTKPLPSVLTDTTNPHKPPNVCRHFKRSPGEVSLMAKCRYTALPEQAGLQLK